MSECMTYHDAIVYKSSSILRWSQMRIFLRTGHLYTPDLAPSLVQFTVYWVDTGVVRCHGVAAVYWDVMRLQHEQQLQLQLQQLLQQQQQCHHQYHPGCPQIQLKMFPIDFLGEIFGKFRDIFKD